MTLSVDDRLDVARALLLWRYVGHELKGGVPCADTERRKEESLRLAGLLGCRAELVRLLCHTDPLTIRAKLLDAPNGPYQERKVTHVPRKAGGYRRKKPLIPVGPLKTPNV